MRFPLWPRPRLCRCWARSGAVEVDTVELIATWGNGAVAIDRCRGCGQLYHYRARETNDWTSLGDRFDITEIWTPIRAAEIESIRADLSYRPRRRCHRIETGWQ